MYDDNQKNYQSQKDKRPILKIWRKLLEKETRQDEYSSSQGKNVKGN